MTTVGVPGIGPRPIPGTPAQEDGSMVDRHNHGERPEWLWARFGDADDYGRHDDLMSVADTLAALADRPGPPVWREDGTGFETGPFRGNNYVSLFWGDESGELIRGISERGREEFEAILLNRP